MTTSIFDIVYVVIILDKGISVRKPIMAMALGVFVGSVPLGLLGNVPVAEGAEFESSISCPAPNRVVETHGTVPLHKPNDDASVFTPTGGSIGGVLCANSITITDRATGVTYLWVSGPSSDREYVKDTDVAYV